MRLPAPIWMAVRSSRSRRCRSLRLPAFYESFLYLVFHWIVLATSWNILSGYSGYFSFGHGAFFGAGHVHDGHARRRARLCRSCGRCRWPRRWPALLGLGIGAVVFRVGRLRGELFALLTLAVTFVARHHRRSTRRSTAGHGVYLSARAAAGDRADRRRPPSTCWRWSLRARDAAIACGIYRVAARRRACSRSTTTRTWPR